MEYETEIKLASGDLERIRAAGFELILVEPRHFEDNRLFDTEDKILFHRGAALRIRSAGGKGLITYKGLIREDNGPLVKAREEIEAEISDPESVVEILTHLGLLPSFRYQKYRTVYTLKVNEHEVEVMLDETPMGNFIEIEGDTRDVTRIIEAAGFTKDEVVHESYPEIQAARCAARGVPLEDLIFSDRDTPA